MDFEQIKETFRKRKAKRDSLVEQLDVARYRLGELRLDYEAAQQGLVVLQVVAQQTQQNLEYHISNLVTTALSSVWGADAPEFKAEINIRRGKTECDLYFVEGEETFKPIDSSGGGTLDIASFALRISIWSLNKNRPTFLLDEPFKYVSPDLQHKVSDMLKMLSKKLGIQIIMVSHAEEINFSADKTFIVEKKDGVSTVREEVSN